LTIFDFADAPDVLFNKLPFTATAAARAGRPAPSCILKASPKPAFDKMGNVAFTSIDLMGKVNGWFIPISVHPICFGIGSIIKKPTVIDDRIEISEMLNMSILIDHDVIDGAPMARFISDLSKNIENGLNIENT